MSTDLIITCSRCRKAIHLGQTGISGTSFGYGRNDTKGRKEVTDFIKEHFDCCHLTVMVHDDIPDTFEDVSSP